MKKYRSEAINNLLKNCVSFLEKYKLNILVFFVYLVLALIALWPLPLKFFTHNPLDKPTDNMFIQWIMAWDWHAITHYPWKFFEANMFWPAKHVLAWGDHEFGLMLLTMPFLLLGSATAAFNALYVIAPVLSAFCLYLLVKETTGNKLAAFWAGMAWGFIGLRFATHPQVFMTQWIPLVLYFLEKYRKISKPKYLWGIGISSFLAFSVGIYLSIFTACAIIIYSVGILFGKLAKLKKVIIALSAVAVGTFFAAPLYVPSFLLNLKHPTIRDVSENIHNSLALADFVPKLPPGHLASDFFKLFIDSPKVSYMYLGVVFFAALLVGILIMLGKVGKITKEQKVLMLTFFFMFTFAFLLLLGPEIRLFSQSSEGIKNPVHYFMYYVFPGFKVLRVPLRWFWLYFMGLTIIASFGMAWFIELFKSKKAQLFVIALVTLLLIIEQFPISQPTKFYSINDSPTAQWLAANASEKSILELPVSELVWPENNQIVEGRRMYYSTYHWAKRGSGAISPFVSGDYVRDSIIYSSINTDQAALALIRKYQFRYIIVYPADYQKLGLPEEDYKKTLSILGSQKDFKKVAEFNDGTIFKLIK